MDKAGVAFLVLICILVALVVSILGFVPEEVPPDVPEVTPPTPEMNQLSGMHGSLHFGGYSGGRRINLAT